MGRPSNEIKAFEWVMVILAICLICLYSSCCPKVTQQPPQIVDRWDTAYITLPPPPPIVMPPDSTEIVLHLSKLCDSTWRAANRARFSSGQRIRSQVDISETTLRFTCKEDSLVHLLDSIRAVQINHSRETVQEIVVEKCPSGWPKWLHSFILVASFIIVVICLIIVARSRL